MHDHAIDALLDAINSGHEEIAAAQARVIAHQVAPLRCPDCGSMQFVVEQLTWGRQDYDASDPDRNCWGESDHGMEYEDYPLRAVCAECESDCTAQFAAAHVTTFYREPQLADDINDPAPTGVRKRIGVETGCGKAECRDCYEPDGKAVARG